MKKFKTNTPIACTALYFSLLLIFSTTVLANDYSVTYQFAEPQIQELANGNQLVKIDDTRLQQAKIGAPILPVKTARIFIPAEEQVTSIQVSTGSAQTIVGSYRLQHATQPYPLSYQGAVTLDVPDPAVYGADTFYPATTHIERGSQYLAGEQIVEVELHPVLYNPVQQTIKYYRQFKVVIQTEWQGRPDEVMVARNLPADREQLLAVIDNPVDYLSTNPLPSSWQQTSLQADGIIPLASREYVVITTAAMMPAFTYLTNHRQSAAGGGFTTHIEDIAKITSYYWGVDDTEKLRMFIRDMYLNYGTKYVLLGGDADGSPNGRTIPIRGVTATVSTWTDNDIPSDLYFGCLDGTWNYNGNHLWGEDNDGLDGGDIDWLSEVYVGRIPADTPDEALEQINKIIAFENGTPPYNTLLVGEKLDDTPTGVVTKLTGSIISCTPCPKKDSTIGTAPGRCPPYMTRSTPMPTTAYTISVMVIHSMYSVCPTAMLIS